jgi:two-component sensor histidine kinase
MFAELRKREDDLTAVNAALSVSVHEKEVLLAEVHHRVKNNLTVILGLLNLKMDENKDSAFRETINEIKAKIYGIAHVHEQMYYTGNFSSLAFGGYIQSLATEAARLFSGNRNIDLIFNVEEVLITVNQAVPCGLIFLEILTNAYKHAFKDRSNGKITISLTGGDKVILVISDDGVGIAKDSANTRRMGMTIIKALVEQLAGEWDMSGACGVRHRIEFVPQL